MKYTIVFSDRVNGKQITLSREFDETTPIEEAYSTVRDQVEKWIKNESVPRPEPPKAIGFEAQPPKIPEFDPAVLMTHSWKKGKKCPDGSYGEGTLSYGWDFADLFPESVIQVLKKGPVTIDQYEFSLDKTGKFVQTRKKREA